jgi:tetratricopeptide (TPR) repeat protein
MAQSTNPKKTFGRPRPGRGPLLARFALLVGAPIIFFCALEGTLRLAGFGVPTGLFLRDGEPGLFRTNPNFTAPFMPASFGIKPLNFRIRKHKDPGSLRVFVLGESAAQGTPDPEFGFAALLRAQLRARYPARTVEVFNLGITAIDSHVVYRIARQLVGFRPDLLVIYMGNNEVIGPYGPGCAYLPAMPPLWIIRCSVWVRSTRSGQLLLAIWGRLVPSAARSREWRGMETFAENAVAGDDPRLEAVYRNFSSNLNDIVDLASGAGVKTVLATVVANLKDSAPFISLHRQGLSAGEEKAWKEAEDAGLVASDLGDPNSARFGYEAALKIDPEFADTHFRLGRLAESLGENAEARRHYLDALHWDALRFRPDARLNEIIRKVAHGAEGAVVLVDAARALGSDPLTDAPLPGREILFDHVHFNWDGNFRMSQLLADGCTQALFGRRVPGAPALDQAGCAAALGYTPEARLKMLQVMVQLTLRPPFTGQYTFSADQAALKRQVEATTAELERPGAVQADIGAVDQALQLDPENGPLAARLAVMEANAGNPAGALLLQEKVEALEPRSSEHSIQEAKTLIRLGRFDEAEAMLLGSVGLDREYFAAGNALVDLWTGTRGFDKGRRFFEGELRKAPANPYLRLEYADLLARSGDRVGAEREERRIWDADPGSRPAMAALEMLVKLFGQERRAGDADALSLEARTRQPGDYFNNQRLVGIFSSRNDPAGTVDSLQALEKSGPFDSGQHIDLAHRLADLNRVPEMLDELARARDIARIENNDRQAAVIDGAIGSYRRRFSDGQGP